MQPERTWVYAPSPTTLRSRWDLLVGSPPEEKSELFKESRDANLRRVNPALPGQPVRDRPFTEENGAVPTPVRVAYRAFDRQWHIPFKGSGGGRVLPLYREREAAVPNIAPGLLAHLAERLGTIVAPEDLLAYVAALAAHDGYSRAFARELDTPGVRIPLTASYELYQEAVVLGREVVWLHTYGERYTDPSSGRPAAAPRMPDGRRPKVTASIPDDEAGMPESLEYDEKTETLRIGEGRVSPVPARVFAYDVGGTNVLRKWFGYRRRTPAGKSSSPLDHVNPTTWSPDYTTDLLNLLNVLGRLVELELAQVSLLARVTAGTTITEQDLRHAGVLPVDPAMTKPPRADKQATGDQQTLL